CSHGASRRSASRRCLWVHTMSWSSFDLPANEFAGFRKPKADGGAPAGPRKVAGRLAVPPAEGEHAFPPQPPVEVATPAPVSRLGAPSAADKVRARLAALKGGGGATTGTSSRAPGIAVPVAPKGPIGPERPKAATGGSDAAAPAASVSGPEVLVFRCTGCRHTWVSGRGSTSLEQICKSCGASVVGVLSEGAVMCELVKASHSGAGEVIKIRFDRPIGAGFPAHELEAKLGAFVESELRFAARFFEEDGVMDYVAYRRGAGGDGRGEGRDAKQDVLMVDRMASTFEALCKAEFAGTMRGGEADAKLQGLLGGLVEFRFVSAPERIGGGSIGSAITAAVDFRPSLDVDERVADKVDERVQKLRGVMREMDKKVLESHRGSRGPEPQHPAQWLARVISGLDFHRGIANISGREGHDRVRCMTCRFLGEDCSSDVARSQEVRGALRRLPSFVFQTGLLLGREESGSRGWRERVGPFLEGVAGTRGGECFILAAVDSRDRLRLTLFSHPEWLAGARDRIVAYAQGGQGAPLLSSLVGLGRAAKGLHIVDEKPGAPPQFEAVSAVEPLLRLFGPGGAAARGPALQGTGEAADASLPSRICWAGDVPRCSPVDRRLFEEARGVFRADCGFECLDDLVDFLRDFRHGRAEAQAKPQPRPPR
ncbi:unnamed protein product, partial [Prorocentrum cordatum]